MNMQTQVGQLLEMLQTNRGTPQYPAIKNFQMGELAED